jgi:uncharacterized phage protein (TIGR01671 family)
MRKIKFRGQRIEDKRFIYGGLSIYNKNYEKDQNEHLFLVETAKDNIGFITMMQEIIPETLGQFTGLLDKNGKEIYEGDIVELERSGFVWRFIITFENKGYFGVFKDCIHRNFDSVKNDDYEPEYVMGDFNIERGKEITDFVFENGNDYKIIGSIHEGAK